MVPGISIHEQMGGAKGPVKMNEIG